jgi:GTP-binding protein
MTQPVSTLNASFIISSPDYKKCPAPDMPEYAFIGRSNVGKSSLINMITGQKTLAKTSATPGKTQLINHFLINETWYLVDLPGYGYARRARSTRKLWETVIIHYLLNRTNLVSTFLLLDSRLALQENDRNVINWFGENQLPFALVLTKSDKLSPNKLASNIQAVKDELAEEWDELPPFIVTSATNRIGREQILDYIAKYNKSFAP